MHILPIGFLSGQERRLGPNDQGNKHRLIKLLLVWLLLVTVEKCKGSTGICPKVGAGHSYLTLILSVPLPLHLPRHFMLGGFMLGKFNGDF